ncbi:MAG: M28 family metallopeptidase [Fimbriimonadaceae bacterium]|nr:M28 family metallopeptidase [Fimbriimonadaceae bacterium]
MLLPVLALMLLDTPADIQSMTAQVEANRLKATVEKLASYPNRNTNSDTLTQAVEWLADEYRKIPGLQVEIMKYPVKQGRRIVADKEVVQVIATLPGKTDRRIIVGGHIDTINVSPGTDPLTERSPGANDDASGVALALELARIMSGQKWEQTLCFVAWSGEEQGLFGSGAMAKRAKDENWKIDAVFSNDTVGSSGNLSGQKNDKEIRVFSEETASGAEVRHNSRELARFIEWATRGKVKDFGVKLVFRKDRFGRGGDHTPFNQQGFNAVRFIEVHEEYAWQHTVEDLPKHMDFNYLANVVRLNLVGMATLAIAAEPPTNVRIDMRQGHDTTVNWRGAPDTKYVVYWRETTSPVWQGSFDAGSASTYTVKGINKDDHVFAVGAVGGIPVEAR